MANLSIRKLDNRIYEKLRIRAASNGVSMEEEARKILSSAISAPAQLSDVFQKHFGQKNGVELKLPNKRVPHNPLDFEE